MTLVGRPGLEQRRVANIAELTSRVSNADIPKYLDQLEVPFDGIFDPATSRFSVTPRGPDALRPIDVVLATNMLSVGVDVNRLDIMVLNDRPPNASAPPSNGTRRASLVPTAAPAMLQHPRTRIPRDLPREMPRGRCGAYAAQVQMRDCR